MKFEDNNEEEHEWKQKRTREKEWKWHDIDGVHFSKYTCGLIMWWMWAIFNFFYVYISFALDGYLIYEIRRQYETVGAAVANNNTNGLCLQNSTSSFHFQFKDRQPGQMPCHLVEQMLHYMWIIYLVFDGLYLCFVIYDWVKATKVIYTHDISDSYIYLFSLRFNSVFYYKRYCFYQMVSSKMGIGEKLIILVYQTLYNGKMFIATIPHLVISVLFSFIAGSLSSYESLALAAAKILLMIIEFLLFFFCALAYPFLRWYLDGELEKYTTYRVDKSVTLALSPHFSRASSVRVRNSAVPWYLQQP